MPGSRLDEIESTRVELGHASRDREAEPSSARARVLDGCAGGVGAKESLEDALLGFLRNSRSRVGDADLVEPIVSPKLDVNGNGTLSFEEWAVRSIDKFKGADRDRSGWLTAAEFATTAPPPPKRPRCGC